MNFLTNFLEKIFGNNQSKKEKAVTGNQYLSRWEKERAERIKVAEERLKTWIVAMIAEKGSLAFTWESGNDEGFVTFKDDFDREEDSFEELEVYILEKLEIPDAGEFQMNGSGDIYIENNLVKAKYSSIMKELIDFDEETQQEIYGEGEEESADKVLFAV